jgi:hypothetical protein
VNPTVAWILKIILSLIVGFIGMITFGYLGNLLNRAMRNHGWTGGEDVVPTLFGLLGLALGFVVTATILKI